MMKYPSDLDEERDDATGGYNATRNIIELSQQEKLEWMIEHRTLNCVPHVDMDAILEGREKRMTLEESRQKGIELCNEAIKKLKGESDEK